MSEQQIPIKNGESQNEGPANVWQQLRKQMERIGAAAKEKVDRAALAKKLADRAKVLRGRIQPIVPGGEELAVLAFTKGRQRYGVAISEIVEVQPFLQYTPVPGAPPFIPGVIHWRGAIVSLLDLGELFRFSESGLLDLKAIILVESTGRRLGLLAGEVEEFGRLPIRQLKAPPELFVEVPENWILGVHDENRLILKMDEILRDPRMVEWKEL